MLPNVFSSKVTKGEVTYYASLVFQQKRSWKAQPPIVKTTRLIKSYLSPQQLFLWEELQNAVEYLSLIWKCIAEKSSSCWDESSAPVSTTLEDETWGEDETTERNRKLRPNQSVWKMTRKSLIHILDIKLLFGSKNLKSIFRSERNNERYETFFGAFLNSV